MQFRITKHKKQEKKKHNKTVKHNTIKKELVKRIQQLKQQEKKSTSKGGTDNIVDNIEKSEFDESMKYLQSLANNKTAERKKARKQEREQRKVQQAYMNQIGGNSELNPKMENSTQILDFNIIGIFPI